ncbi:Spo0E like sporulation regulatory protein [Paenibacillus lactis]
MEEFLKRLSEASTALIKLSREFERLEAEHSDFLCKRYPFNSCFIEVVHSMLEWQEFINNHMEVMRLGKKTSR